jgi:hypothetical protein
VPDRGKGVRAVDWETGERLAIVDLRGKGSKARKRANRKARFTLMYGAECEELLTDDSVHHFEVRLLWFMITRMDWDNRLMMSQKAMALAFKVPESQVSRAIQDLRRRGCIHRVSRGEFVINASYAFTGEDDERDRAIEGKRHLFAVPARVET